MKKGSILRTVSGVAFAVVFFGWAGEAWAAFTFTAVPRRGGQTIRFDESQPGSTLRNEEVTLTVTSTEATQYHITQAVYQPLTNERGQTIPAGAFVVFSPSSPLGTLRIKLQTPITLGQDQIYTSNSAGDSDSFILVFNVLVPKNQPGGTYRTQITYTAELLTPKSGVSSQVVTLNVEVDIRATFQIRIQNVQGGSQLSLGRISEDRETASAALRVEIESNAGEPYRVVQQLTEPLRSAEGETLDEDVFRFATAGGEKGSLSAKGVFEPVGDSPKRVYASSGGVGDAFEMEYQAQPPSVQKAGIYTGNLNFRVESNDVLASSRVFNIPVKMEVEPVLDLKVETEHGHLLNFGSLKGIENQKQERRVLLTIKNNLGRPYQITQLSARKLTSAEGTSIPSDYFLYAVESDSGALSPRSPVREGETVLFVSDSEGTPERLTVYYTLSAPADLRAGSYSSDIRYSITAL